MKTLTTTLLAAVSALALAPKPALAGNEGLAALGGFVGGVIVGASLDHHRPAVSCPPSYGPPHRVVVDRCPPPRPAGYWQVVTVKTWVPGFWTTSCHRGRTIRSFVPGHYAYRTDRIWIESGRHDGDRYSYGYGRRR